MTSDRPGDRAGDGGGDERPSHPMLASVVLVAGVSLLVLLLAVASSLR